MAKERAKTNIMVLREQYYKYYVFSPMAQSGNKINFGAYKLDFEGFICIKLNFSVTFKYHNESLSPSCVSYHQTFPHQSP